MLTFSKTSHSCNALLSVGPEHYLSWIQMKISMHLLVMPYCAMSKLKKILDPNPEQPLWSYQLFLETRPTLPKMLWKVLHNFFYQSCCQTDQIINKTKWTSLSEVKLMASSSTLLSTLWLLTETVKHQWTPFVIHNHHRQPVMQQPHLGQLQLSNYQQMTVFLI